MPRRISVEILGDSKSIERAWDRASRSSRKFQVEVKGVSRTINTAFAVASGAVAGFAGASVRAGSQFEDTMQKIVGLSGVAQDAVNKLSGEVLALAPSVGKSPRELAEALYFITSSGIKAADAMSVLEASAKAAAAGLGETKTVADAVTSVMNAYGSSVVSAKDATDVLVSIVREGKGEASEFAGVIGNVAAIASQLGVSFNDVGAALAAMTRLGTDAETSAVQLQQVFSNLVKVSPQAEKAFRSVGLSSAGLRKLIADKGLLAGLQTIQNAFGSDLPKISRAFPDIRALRGVLSLVGKQSAEVTGIFNRLADSAGSLQLAFGAVSGDRAFRFAKLKAQAEVASITLSSALAPAFLKVASAVSAASKFMSDHRTTTKVLLGTLVSLAAVIGTVTVATKTYAAVTTLAAASTAAFAATAGARAWLALIGSITSVRDAVVLLNIALAANPIGAVVVGLAALTAGFVIAYKKSETFRNVVKAVFKASADAVAAFLRVWTFSLDKFLGALSTMARAVSFIPFIGKKFEGVADKIDSVRDHIRGVIDAIDDLGERKVKVTIVPDIEPAAADFTKNVPGFLDTLKRKAQKPLQRPAAFGERGFKVGTAPPVPLGPSVELRNQIFDNSISRALERAQDSDPKGQLAKLGQIASLITARIAKTRDVTRKLNLEDKLLDVRRQTAQVRQQLADVFIDSLQFNVEKAQATGRVRDEIAALTKLRDELVKRGAAVEDVFRANQDLKSAVNRQRDAAQFRTLGLGPTGEELVPLKAGLARQLKQVSSQIDGTFLDTTKTNKTLAAIRKLVLDPFTKVSVEVRSTIKSMLDEINQQFKDHKGPLTKTTGLDTKKIVAGLGLSPPQIREIRGRLSGFNSAGLALAGGPSFQTGGFVGGRAIVVESHTTVQLDGHTLGKTVTRSQQKAKRRNPAQRRGPNRGN